VSEFESEKAAHDGDTSKRRTLEKQRSRTICQFYGEREISGGVLKD
jgi:hypothetical protein